MIIYGIAASLLLSYPVVEAAIKGELCTDISTYKPVVFHEGQNCSKQGVGTPNCTLTTRRESIVHNETICHIEKHQKVEMFDCTVNTTMIVPEDQEFQEWDFDPVPHFIPHTKYNYTCTNKTRMNCETIWQTLNNGSKVAVPGECEPVVWLDCQKVKYTANFETIKHVKKPGPKHKYQTCVEMVVPNKQMCWNVTEVLVSVCETKHRHEYVTVTDKFCEPQLGPPIEVPAGPVPWQERIHKEKCLKPEPEGSGHGQHGTGTGHGTLASRFPFNNVG